MVQWKRQQYTIADCDHPSLGKGVNLESYILVSERNALRRTRGTGGIAQDRLIPRIDARKVLTDRVCKLAGKRQDLYPSALKGRSKALAGR
jgi:hypothetical protein